MVVCGDTFGIVKRGTNLITIVRAFQSVSLDISRVLCAPFSRSDKMGSNVL